jgi:diadenosine tetraphosphate (Ap4A) HIT family hydrolase
MHDFNLDKRLAAVSVQAIDLALSRVLVMDDSRYPWLVLVPRRPGVTELFDLSPAERALLCEEYSAAGAKLKALTRCHKINIANLGNNVPQLHVHVIARNIGDAAWPNPVWGVGEAVPYDPKTLEAFVAKVVNLF